MSPLLKSGCRFYDTAEYPKGIPYYTDLAELLRENEGEFVICGPGRMKKMYNVDEYVTRFQLEKSGGKIFRVYESVLLTRSHNRRKASGLFLFFKNKERRVMYGKLYCKGKRFLSHLTKDVESELRRDSF